MHPLQGPWGRPVRLKHNERFRSYGQRSSEGLGHVGAAAPTKGSGFYSDFSRKALSRGGPDLTVL